MCVFGKKNLTSNIYLSSFVTLPGKLRAFFFIVIKLRKCTKPSTANFKNIYLKQSLTWNSHTRVRTLKEKTEVRWALGHIVVAMMAPNRKQPGVRSRG